MRQIYTTVDNLKVQEYIKNCRWCQTHKVKINIKKQKFLWFTLTTIHIYIMHVNLFLLSIPFSLPSIHLRVHSPFWQRSHTTRRFVYIEFSNGWGWIWQNSMTVAMEQTGNMLFWSGKTISPRKWNIYQTIVFDHLQPHTPTVSTSPPQLTI